MSRSKIYLIWGKNGAQTVKSGLLIAPQLLHVLLIHLANSFQALRPGLGLKGCGA